MASFPFRPPQFSDDVAWLPAWLQPNHSASTPQNLDDEELSRHSLQNVGENNQVKDSNLSTIKDSRYICQLYLSGEESSPVTLTTSCEKVLHFNLHLSTDGTPSIISNPLLHTSHDDKLNSALALVNTREMSECNIGHVPKINIVPSPSSDKYFGNFTNQTPLSNAAGQKPLEILNSNSAEDDDISDAVELSVAASEALAILNIVQSGSFSEALSTSAIIEVALRVKQARLVELKDFSYCFENSDSSADTLSDIGDSEMEDAFKDVGLFISSLDNTSFNDLSTSRVKETPMSEVPGEDEEVQCEWQKDQEIYFDNCVALELQEINPDTNKSKDLPAEISDNEKLEKLCRNPHLEIFVNQSQDGNLDDQQTLQKEKNDITHEDGFPHQLELKSIPQSQHSSKRTLDSTSTIWHSHYADINEVKDGSSCRFQSRWFGGWPGTEVDAFGQLKSKGRNVVPKFFVGETSYLSESMDVFPDQNSIVHHQHYCSNRVESGKPFEDSCKTVSEGAFVSQEVIKDSASFIDPLCSTVPCSISAQTSNFFPHNNNKYDHQDLDAFKNLPTGMEIAQTSSDPNTVGKEKHNTLDFDDVGPDPLIRRQLTSLKTYSTGMPGNSAFSFKRKFDCGFVSFGENDARVVADSINSLNDKDTTKQLPMRSLSNCASAKSNQEVQEMKLLPVEQYISCTNTSGGSKKQLPIKSVFECSTGKENHAENVCARLVQDQSEMNEVELQVNVDNIPTSPLIMCRTTRRVKAPKLIVSDVTTTNLLEDQAPAPDKICHKFRQIPQDQSVNLLKSDVPTRKQVRFSNVDFQLQVPQVQLGKNLSRMRACEHGSSCRLGYRPENSDQEHVTVSQEVKERLTKCRIKGRKRAIFQGLDFLLTGFSKKKEKEIEALLRKHGGMVLSDIPAPPPYPRRKSLRLNAERLPVVLCTKKLQTTRFLYGCAVNAFLLKVGWAYNSIRVGSVLPPDKYIILSNNRMQNQIGKSISQNDNDYIFDKVGIMLHGTHSFCTKFARVIKHGRGHVYKSLQWLVQGLQKKKISLGAVVAEDENRATRLLKKCASEQKLAVRPANWITNSLFEGKLLPFTENHHSSNSREIRSSDVPVLPECSQEI
ncbi:uncharacterized protein LOC110717809 isoform X2 [Chenopodium quinoa]|uniref:uncharacterized protein LOC110717809 isoform X2 n=1 Tax=Chenopodium quinoa TaxID=63459 RepID=UPI000B78537F|nr:uncharacterized protein LOC110717809 isoform X2 [Chenopodium quinoa]